jgi:hypothetical protein
VAWIGPVVAHGAILAAVMAVVVAAGYRLAQIRGRLSERSFALWGMILGTPLAFYSAFGPFFSHLASFVVISLFLLIWDRSRDGRRQDQWILLGALLGWAACVRPQNALLGVVFLAELGGWIRHRKAMPSRALWMWLKGLAIALGSSLVTVMPLLISWWALYGSPLALPKLEEMRWFNPALGSLIFSDFHGILPWTPLMGLATVGLVMLSRRDGVLGWGLLGAFAVQIYVNAANEVWWSGGSFGCRRLTDVSLIVAYGLVGWQKGWGLGLKRRGRGVWLRAAQVVILLGMIWTTTLLLAERRGTLPLSRYVAFSPEFLQQLPEVYTQPGATVDGLTRPFQAALGSGRGEVTRAPDWRIGLDAEPGLMPLLLRILGGLGLATFVVGMALGLRKRRPWFPEKPLGRNWGPGLALGSAVIVSGILLISAARTPPVLQQYPELKNRFPERSLILWDNMIELALYEIVRGRPDLGLEAAQRAIDMRPENHSGWWYRAAAYRVMGNWPAAAAAAQRVLILQPDHGPSLALLEQARLQRVRGIPSSMGTISGNGL